MNIPQAGPLARLIILYTSIRVALFLAVFIIMLFTSVNVLIELAVAFVGSALLSYPLARKQRAAMSELLLARQKSRRRRYP